MNRLTSFLTGVVVGAIAVFGSMNFYVVRTNDGVQVVRKVVPHANFPYVDIRNFTVGDWQKHAELAAALTKAGKTNVLGQSTANSVGETVSDAVNNWMTTKQFNQ